MEWIVEGEYRGTEKGSIVRGGVDWKEEGK